MSVLDEILAHKRRELAQAKQRVPAEPLAKRAREMQPKPRDFGTSWMSTSLVLS